MTDEAKMLSGAADTRFFLDALIGHSGFVGGMLKQQHAFGALFNTKNIQAIAEGQFDTVVCAAAPGSMFLANRDPQADRAQIDALIAQLDRVRTRRFILISSIAVLADPGSGADEETQDFQQEIPYGKNRRMLEEYCAARYADCLIIRLPALYGNGLRKNFLFDLMNPVPSMLTTDRLAILLNRLPAPLRDGLAACYTQGGDDINRLDRGRLNNSPYRSALDIAVRNVGLSATQFHNAETTYQFYRLDDLWKDVCIASDAGLRLLHLATAPLRAKDIHLHLLGTTMPQTSAPLHREDMRTRHAEFWGLEGVYLAEADTVLDGLKSFFDARPQS